MLRPKPIRVTPLENYQLSIFFDNGEIRIFDATPLMVGDWFGQLKDKTIFKTVHIAGNTIEWINGQDVCPDDLYYLSKPIKEKEPTEEKPNAETIASIEELENGGGTLFTGSTEALFAELMEN